MLTKFRMLASLAIASLASFAACSESGSSSKSDASRPPAQAFGGCILQGDICINIDLSRKDDAGPDASPAAGRDASADASGEPGECSLLNPKYKLEFDQTALKGALKTCENGCGASECCYLGLSCLAK